MAGDTLSNVTVPGPRYFDHTSSTGDGSLRGGAIVALANLPSSSAQSGSAQRRTLRHRAFRRRRQQRQRPLRGRAVLGEPDRRRRVLDGHVAERGDVVVGVQAQRDAGGLPVGDDRPGQALVGAVNSFGTVTVNMPHCRPGRKCDGWPRSGPPGSMRLLGPIGNIDLERVVAIEIADEKGAAAVGVLAPALERAGDAGAELPARLARQLLR